MRRPLALAALAGVVLLAGCAPGRVRVPRPGAVAAETLVETLAARRAAVTSLRARARLRTGVSGLWTRQAVLVRRPECVRIDVLSPFGLALAVGVQGGLLWAYPPNEHTRYEGAATPANLMRFLGAPVTLPDVVDVLLGVPPLRVPAGPAEASVTPEGEQRLTIPLADGVQTVWFAGERLEVVRAEETRRGAPALRVVFTEHVDGFPHVIAVEGAAGGTATRLVFDTAEPNATVDPSLCAPPAAARVLPLEAQPG